MNFCFAHCTAITWNISHDATRNGYCTAETEILSADIPYLDLHPSFEKGHVSDSKVNCVSCFSVWNRVSIFMILSGTRQQNCVSLVWNRVRFPGTQRQIEGSTIPPSNGHGTNPISKFVSEPTLDLANWLIDVRKLELTLDVEKRFKTLAKRPLRRPNRMRIPAFHPLCKRHLAKIGKTRQITSFPGSLRTQGSTGGGAGSYSRSPSPLLVNLVHKVFFCSQSTYDFLYEHTRTLTRSSLGWKGQEYRRLPLIRSTGNVEMKCNF